MKNFNHKNILKTSFAFCLATVMVMSGCNFRLSTQSSDSNAEQSSASQQSRTSIDEIETSYGYDSLEVEGQQVLYGAINEYAATANTDDIELTDYVLSTKQIMHTVQAFIDDHPEIFWLDEQYSYSSDEYYGTTLALSYTVTSDELSTKQSELNSVVDKVVSSAPSGTDYEVEKYVNDYLVDNCTYDDDASAKMDSGEYQGEAHNAYGALVEKMAVCDGYSQAFKLICNKLGIDCVTVSGYVDGDGAHAWNAIKLDGKWSFVDVTWDDSTNNESKFNYLYFNETTELISKDHKIAELFTEVNDSEYDDSKYIYNTFVPECTDTTYNYILRECPTFTGTDNAESDGIIEGLTNSVENSEEAFAFSVSDSLDINATYESVINDSFVFDWFASANSNSSSNQISDNSQFICYEEQSVIVIIIDYK